MILSVDGRREEKTMSDDTIYRQTAIDAMKKLCENYTRTTSTKHPHIDFIIEELEALPSAQRIGRWIYNDYGNGCGNWHCSVCNKIPIVYDKNANFCPHCGARMEKDNNG